jgi:hypothetical protein
MTRLKAVVCAVLLCLGALVSPLSAQNTSVVVPDVTGLSAPRAAAELNRVGLALGAQMPQPWTEASGLPQGAIAGQSIAPGESVPAGTAVDVTVLATPNVSLVYDENDFTIFNRTGGDMRLDNLTFQSVEGNAAAFYAGRWAGGLRAGYCVQVWSVQRSVPKDVPGCGGIQNWFTNVNNTSEHFWTALNGVTRFAVFQDGIQRGTCDAAPAGAQPMTCEVYLPAGQAGAVTEYLYFAYTPSRLVVRNASPDRWMPLRDAVILNNHWNLTQPGAPIPLGDPTLYGLMNPAATLAQLAPGQCVLFTDSSQPEALNLPEPCDVIAMLNIDPNLIFWAAPFTINSVTDGQQRQCAPATLDRLTVCIMPR